MKANFFNGLLTAGILFLNFSCGHIHHKKIYNEYVNLFGTFIEWETHRSDVHKSLKQQIEVIIQQDAKNFDPDCMYRPLIKGKCEQVPNLKRLREIESLASEVSSETKGNFNIYMNKAGKTVRDFGGIYQGFIIDKLKETGPALLNFSGDIFLDPEHKSKEPVWIAHPEIPDMNYLRVEMRSGWLLSASAPELAPKMRHGKTGKPLSQSDFQKIVLFASPDFLGGRLDAWATALISGGKDLLDHLWSLDEYRGEWAYLYFKSSTDIRCSSNLKCNLTGPNKTKSITVKW